LGLVSESDKHGLLAASTALLLPSRTDSFGIVFLESWAHGRPVIGARAGGIPGLVSDGEDGLLTPFGDVPALAQAIKQLLTDTDLAAKMGRRGQQKVNEHYTWDRVSDHVLTIYQQILAAAP
jgi:glycosyltransferase involved in cell wall biosynthesis